MTDLCGCLVADKGAGVTSFQVVAHLRRALRVGKVGHGGTLDPMATGVLPILLGEATKLAAYLLTDDKEYVATIRLGVATDTLDATGRILAERPVPPLTADDLRSALAAFEGEIEQVPPMFSALHVGGRRLHELARAGVEVERAPRTVRIDAIELLDWAPPALAVRVACGKGTYIRSLASDLGAGLGCGAHLAALRRTRVGGFALGEAVSWEVIREGDPAALRSRVVPPDRAVAHLPRVALSEAAVRRLVHGQPVETPAAGLPEGAETLGVCRLYAGETFLGLGRAERRGLAALRLFHADRSRTGGAAR